MDPVGLSGRGCAADDEVVLSRPVQVAHGRGREDAVGGELGPSCGVGAVRRVERVRLLAERTRLDYGPVVRDRRRRQHTPIGLVVARRVLDDLVPQLVPARAVGPVAAELRRSRVARAEVEVAVHDGGRRVDRRVLRYGDALIRRCAQRGAAVHCDAASLTGPDGGRVGRSAPPRRNRPVAQVEGVDVPLAIAELDDRAAAHLVDHR